MHGITKKNKKKAKMGAKEIILFLLLVSFQFYHPTSLFSLGNNLPSVHVQENVGQKEMDRDSNSTHGDGNGIAHRSNFASSVVGGRGGGSGSRGGGGGRSGGSSEDANGGGSTTPSSGAGTAVIPLYAAGAANGHRNNHHGAANCNRSCLDLPTLCALILASLVVHIYVVLGIENLT